jgi:hypothetical protein
VQIIVYRGTEESLFVFWGVGSLSLNLTNVRSHTPIIVSLKLALVPLIVLHLNHGNTVQVQLDA